MKKIREIKVLSALFFSGLILAYMVVGCLYDIILQCSFNYVVPFIFILQGLGFAIIVSILWYDLTSKSAVKKLNQWVRLFILAGSIWIIGVVCLLTFMAFPTIWAKLWLLVMAGYGGALLVIFMLDEAQLQEKGKRLFNLSKSA